MPNPSSLVTDTGRGDPLSVMSLIWLDGYSGRRVAEIPREFIRKVMAEIRPSKKSYQAENNYNNAIRNLIRRRFEKLNSNPIAQIDPNGNQWKPISPFTIAHSSSLPFANNNPQGRTSDWALFDTGGIRDAITVTKNANDRVTRNEAYTGIGVSYNATIEGPAAQYGFYHEIGFTIRSIFGKRLETPINVPARPFLGLSRSQLETPMEGIGVTGSYTSVKEMFDSQARTMIQEAAERAAITFLQTGKLL